MDHYISVSFKTSEEKTAMLEALLMDRGFEGVEEKESETIASVRGRDFNEEELKALFMQFDVEYKIEKVEQQNWNAQWEHSFEPVLVDDFAAIRASFHAPVKNVQHEIIITPKMSFGTGHHATTFLVIQQMQELDFHGKTVIDFGTGTGVLAILAEKLGAKEILAIDNDDWSINNAKENIAANNCNQITLQKADEMTHTAKADIVLANINFNVIVANMAAIREACSTGAQIIFSGLLASDETQMNEILINNNFSLDKCVHKNNWIAIRVSLI
jgi:ribosomal protein L11 methyltransferase